MSKSSRRPASRNGRDQSEGVDITTYPAAVRYLYKRADIERMRAVSIDSRSFKLERTEAVLNAIESPHRDISAIHVAGTVGKGSTVAMIASMLRACGYVVGEYTSPHLVEIGERVRINGEQLSRSRLTEHLCEIAEAVKPLDFEPTFFELITAIAFRHFAEEAVDVAVIETGLGGRFDCTNVITPHVSVITTIDYDHMHLLGRTLPEIAREKAGIFKPGVPALSVEQVPEVEQALRDAAAAVGAPIAFVDKEIEFSWRFGATADRGPHTQVCLITETSRFEHVPVPLPGEHQAFNCGVALAAVDVLKARKGYDVPESKALIGLAETVVPGRMELVLNQPRIVVDGAHNPKALGAFFKGLGATLPYDSLVCVFGCCEDKDVNSMLDRLAYGADKVIFTRARGIPRAADPDDLRIRYAERTGKMSQTAGTLAEALHIAGRAVGREDLICVTGSFYLVGETMKHLAEIGAQPSGAA